MSTERITDSEVWVRSVEKRLRAQEIRGASGASGNPVYLPIYYGYAEGTMSVTYSGGAGAGEQTMNLSMGTFDSVSVASGTRLTLEKRGYWQFGATVSCSSSFTDGSRAFASFNWNDDVGLSRFRYPLVGSGETYLGVGALVRTVTLQPADEYAEINVYQNFDTGSVTWSGRWWLRWLGGQ